jgi:ABC-type transport system substrate-binding protein
VPAWPFGPRADQVLIKIYGSYAAEFLAFKAQDIDLMDWPLAVGDYAELESIDPTHATYSPAFYKDFGIRELDLNNQQYPTDVLSFRQALSYMIDKQYFINNFINIGSTVVVKADSVVEPLSGWYNPAVTDMYNLAPRTTVTPFPDDLIDFQAARNLLHDDLGTCMYPCPVCGSMDHCSWIWPAKPEDPHGYVNRAGALLHRFHSGG